MSSYDPTTRLREIFLGSAGKFEFNGSDAITTMVLIREMGEFRNRKKDFATLNLYCNWTVQPESMSSLIGSRFLADAAEALGPTRDTSAMSAHINKALSPTTFRDELIETFRTHDLPTRNFELKIGWKIFSSQYFKSLMHKRLGFPAKQSGSPKLAALHRGMMKKAGDDASRVVNSIRIKDTSKDIIQWAIEFGDGTELCGALENP